MCLFFADEIKNSFFAFQLYCIVLQQYYNNTTTILRQYYNIYKHNNESKAGLDRPLNFQEAETPRISGLSAHGSDKVVSPTHRPPLPPGDSPQMCYILRIRFIIGLSK
jgi:hypothetical protein